MLQVSMEQHLTFAGLRFHFTSIIWELQYSESFVGYFCLSPPEWKLGFFGVGYLWQSMKKRGLGGTSPGVHSGSRDCVRIVGTHLEGEWDEKLR